MVTEPVETITPATTRASRYRSDIDGLRAIAVLSVVLYHAGFTTFGGGYVGVDIFFVISGFLITRLLTSEIVEGGGRLDFGRFYLRRARRLLPALFFTLLASSVVAIWSLSPRQLELYGASLAYSVLSVSNIYFYLQSGYFDTAAALKPLLHTWSLGVEEQFYLLWPLLLFLCVPRRWLAAAAVAIAGLVSLALSEALLAEHADAAFYLMPFRIFQFSLGASLVWLIPRQTMNETARDALLVVGFVLIACAVFLFSDETPFPGLHALVPSFGAVLCIYAGETRRLGRLLSNRLSVSIGLISYSLYLVHWPIVSFFKRYAGGGEFQPFEKCVLVLASLLIAAMMFRWIERPYRRAKVSNRPFVLGCVLFAALISILGASMAATGGWSWRPWATNGSVSTFAVARGKELRFQVRKELCQRKVRRAECDNVVEGRVNALIIGDSHAIDALNAFERIYPEHNFAMSELAGCPPYRDIEKLTAPNHPDRLKCKALNEIRFDPAYLKRFDYIVINVLFEWYTPAHLREYLEFLKQNDIRKVIVLGGYLTLSRDMYELLNEYGNDPSAIGQWVVRHTRPRERAATVCARGGILFPQ